MQIENDKMLQSICEQVESDYGMVSLSEDGQLYSDYAKDVAKKYLSLILANEVSIEELKDSIEDTDLYSFDSDYARIRNEDLKSLIDSLNEKGYKIIKPCK